MTNQQKWTRDEGIAKWLVASRLDRFSALSRGVGEHETEKRELLQRIRTLGGLARAKFATLMSAS